MRPKNEVAEHLARAHYEVEPGITQIFRIRVGDEIETKDDEPIKLLEINEDTIPAGILPLQFAPDVPSGIDYSSVIVEITPSEFNQIGKRELELPEGWQVAELLPRDGRTGNGDE